MAEQVFRLGCHEQAIARRILGKMVFVTCNCEGSNATGSGEMVRYPYSGIRVTPMVR